MVFAENKVFFQQETYLLFFGMIKIQIKNMKKTQIALLSAVFLFIISCNSSAPDNLKNIEPTDSTQVVDEIMEEKDIDIVKEETCTLPPNYFGNWSGDPEINDESCEWGFWLTNKRNLISFTSEMEVGGSNGTCRKVKDYYEVEYEGSDEMTAQDPNHIPEKSQLLLKMVGKNLFVSFSGQENDFQKMYRCPNLN